MPRHAIPAVAADFEVPAGVAVMHYYGSGGWGIQWGQAYLLTAPYFSNFELAELLTSQLTPIFVLAPNLDAVRAGFANTPVARTSALLVGHGHVDHTADVPAFFAPGLIATRPALIADRSTTNQLAAMSPSFGCVAPIDYDNAEEATTACPVPGVRITALHHAHAPHLNLVGLDVAAFGGFVKKPQAALPAHAPDYKLGNTWAFVIDLLDEKGEIAFRIHYVDASASPPHGVMPKALLAQRAIDVHIACVAGFEQSDSYPDAILEHHRVRYVLGAHWEDFFQPRSAPLMPLRQVLTEQSMERFVSLVDQSLPAAGRLEPANKSPEWCAPPRACGPRGRGWALPVPGETFQFVTAP